MVGYISRWLAAFDHDVLRVLAPLSAALLASALDDLAVDLLWAFAWLKDKLSPSARLFPPGERQLDSAPRRRIVILIPLWKEHRVIGEMLEHNLAAIRCDSYEIFAGVYPNDPETEAAVRSVAQSFANVHLAPVPHDGPTSKADCLNWAFQHLLIEEESRGAQFDIVIVHDAEDLIHPEELRWMNYYSARFDFIQTPVLPLPTPFRALAHGLYCDDFAWNHTCDMTVRPRFGGFVPARAWARASGATLWKNSPPLSKTASSTRRRSPRTTRMVCACSGWDAGKPLCLCSAAAARKISWPRASTSQRPGAQLSGNGRDGSPESRFRVGSNSGGAPRRARSTGCGGTAKA